MDKKIHITFFYLICLQTCVLLAGCEKDLDIPHHHGPQSAEPYWCYYAPEKEILPNGQTAATIFIGGIQNGTDQKSAVMTFGNKIGTPNLNFDLGNIYVVPKSDSTLRPNNNSQYWIFGHQTDNILPIRFKVKNHADGDFLDDGQSFFTGGFHGYKNMTSIDATPTLYEKEKVVIVDGDTMKMGEIRKGNHVQIIVRNLLQASNTQKKDGQGRYAMEQDIYMDFCRDTAFVRVDFTPLEDILAYQIDGLGFYNDLDSIQFIGSRTKMGIYKNNIVNRADKSVKAIRQFDSEYKLDAFINPHYGIGDLKYNSESYNAQTTEVQKSYFHLLASPNDTPWTFTKGETISFRGGYVFSFKGIPGCRP